jgi:hypothetical protein
MMSKSAEICAAVTVVPTVYVNTFLLIVTLIVSPVA